jgi:hypothetical protein
LAVSSIEEIIHSFKEVWNTAGFREQDVHRISFPAIRTATQHDHWYIPNSLEFVRECASPIRKEVIKDQQFDGSPGRKVSRLLRILSAENAM